MLYNNHDHRNPLINGCKVGASLISKFSLIFNFFLSHKRPVCMCAHRQTDTHTHHYHHLVRGNLLCIHTCTCLRTHTHTHGGQKFFSLLDSQNPSIGPPFSRITEHSHKARLVQACLPRLLVTVYQGLQTVLIASFMLNYFEKISQPCLKVVELFLSTLN